MPRLLKPRLTIGSRKCSVIGIFQVALPNVDMDWLADFATKFKSLETYRIGGLYPSFSTVDIHIRQGEGAIEPHNRVLFASDITRRPCVTERMPLAHHNMIANSETGVFGRLAGIYESRTLCRTRHWKVKS